MTTPAAPLLTIEELAAHADVPVRTVRFYIAEGLLPGASSRGKGASYSQEHLDRLMLIRLLVARHLPLAEIHALVTVLPPDEVTAVLKEEQAHAGETSSDVGMAPSPKDYLSALLDQARGSSEAQRPSPYAKPPTLRETPFASPPVGTSPKRHGSSRGGHGPGMAWQRWELAPGIELEVRADIAQARQEVIERVLSAAREALSQRNVNDKRKD